MLKRNFGGRTEAIVYFKGKSESTVMQDFEKRRIKTGYTVLNPSFILQMQEKVVDCEGRGFGACFWYEFYLNSPS